MFALYHRNAAADLRLGSRLTRAGQTLPVDYAVPQPQGFGTVRTVRFSELPVISVQRSIAAGTVSIFGTLSAPASVPLTQLAKSTRSIRRTRQVPAFTIVFIIVIRTRLSRSTLRAEQPSFPCRGAAGRQQSGMCDRRIEGPLADAGFNIPARDASTSTQFHGEPYCTFVEDLPSRATSWTAPGRSCPPGFLKSPRQRYP